MRNDQIFVLMLVVLLPMSGCFDGGGVGEAEGQVEPGNGQDSDTGGIPNSGGGATAESSQSRTWYSSGGVYQTYWDDGQYSGYYHIDDNVYVGGWEVSQMYDGNNDYEYRSISSASDRCIDWGPYYDSSTGDLLGERCNDWGTPQSESDWNLTDCTDNGGIIVWEDAYGYGYAPECMMAFATINSSVGEALLIYEWSGFSMTSTCEGVSMDMSSSILYGKEYVIAPGTALECSHEIYKSLTYTNSESSSNTQSIWSMVYAIQDTTVV